MSELDAQRSFRRRSLGRGLDALLAATREPNAEDALLISVDPARVSPNPEQPRRSFDDAALDVLAESIRLHGLLHPIVVQRTDGGYQLVAGERRLRAAQRAGVASIPAIVRPAAESARQSLEMALTENLLRTDLNPIEEAAAYSRLSDAFGLSHEAIALRVGRSRAAVTNAIRLLNLAARVQQAVAEGRISAGHARALVVLPEPRDQELLAAQIEAEGWNVRQTERAVQSRLAAPPQRRAEAETPPLTPDDAALQRALEQALGLPVALRRRRRGGGEVAIAFTDEEDLDGLYRRLGGGEL